MWLIAIYHLIARPKWEMCRHDDTWCKNLPSCGPVRLSAFPLLIGVEARYSILIFVMERCREKEKRKTRRRTTEEKVGEARRGRDQRLAPRAPAKGASLSLRFPCCLPLVGTVVR